MITQLSSNTKSPQYYEDSQEKLQNQEPSDPYKWWGGGGGEQKKNSLGKELSQD